MDRRRITLRPATSDDYDFLWNLNRTAQGRYVDETWGWDEAFQRSYFNEHFDPTERPRQVIQLDLTDIGTLGVERREDCVLVAEIGILPEYQGMGIGSLLLAESLAEARRDGIPCRLQVLKVNPAKALYERLGFVVTHETETHYLMSTKADGGAASR